MRAAEGLQVETIVVDNNSADDSVAMVEQLFPSVTILANTDNVGFGKANNQALRIAKGRHVLILNPDTIIQEDTLRVLVDFLDTNEEAGAVGCKILNPDGSFALESRRSFPTPSIALARMTGLSKLFPGSRAFGRYNLTYLPNDEVCEVDALSGSCMMIRGSALRGSPAAGDDRAQDGMLLFDEQFFMYGEDLDLCYRIQQAGWKLYYEPSTQIIHYKGESTKKGDLRYVRLFYGAMLLFAEKHFKGKNAGLLIILLRAGIFARATASALHRLARRMSPVLADIAITSVSFAAVAAWRFGRDDIPPPLLGTVVPVYSLATVSALAALGAYRFGYRTKLRYPVIGAVTGLVAISALSFFVKEIAFSRVVVGIGAVVSALLMAGWRAVWRDDRERSRRALLVGPQQTAGRLYQMLAENPAPPFELIGYVAAGESELPEAGPNGPRLAGRLQQLADVIRLERAGCVIFVPGALTNEEIFGWMQILRNRPVQFKMLTSTESHVIGKSSIDELSLPALVEAGQALGLSRSTLRHRLFDVVVGCTLLAATPLLFAARLGGNVRARTLLSRIGMLPSVVTGKRSMVGFDEKTAYRPPSQLGIKPGVFSVTNGCDVPQELDRRYGFYAIRQSAGIDWAIIRKRLSESGIA